MARIRAISFEAERIIEDSQSQINQADEELEAAKREKDPEKRDRAIAEAQAKINRVNSRLSDVRLMKN